MTIELCSLCNEKTGRAGRHEDSIYICPGLPCEVGPLCETCYSSFTAFFDTEERELLTIAYMSGHLDASEKFKAEKKELVEALNDLTFECFEITNTRAPSIATYNRVFSILEKHRDRAITTP